MGAREVEVAVAAALAAGAVLRRHFAAGVETEWKGRGDPVTVADREAEDVVRAHIADAFGDLVVGEEGAEPLPEAEVRGRRRWYVDPLDGTTNFTKGQPRWAVAVAFCDADDVVRAAAIHVPLTGEVLAAVRGQGATRDGRALRRGDVAPAEALALLGPLGELRDSVPIIGRMTLSLRVTGSTVHDLADVAVGRADLYLGAGQGRWDLAAGALIGTEAGAAVTDLDGKPVTEPSDSCLAAAPSTHAAVVEALRGAPSR